MTEKSQRIARIFCLCLKLDYCGGNDHVNTDGSLKVNVENVLTDRPNSKNTQYEKMVAVSATV